MTDALSLLRVPRMIPSFRSICTAACALLGTVSLLPAEDFQGSSHVLPYDEDIIGYSAQTPENPVSKLQARLQSGELTLKWDERFGWLPALLARFLAHVAPAPVDQSA
jgi:hypothetical protein